MSKFPQSSGGVRYPASLWSWEALTLEELCRWWRRKSTSSSDHHRVMETQYLAHATSSPGLWQAAHSAAFNVDFGVALLGFWSHNRDGPSWFFLYRWHLFGDRTAAHQAQSTAGNHHRNTHGLVPLTAWECRRGGWGDNQGWGHASKGKHVTEHSTAFWRGSPE